MSEGSSSGALTEGRLVDHTGLTLLKQGAEARLYATTFMGRDCVVKERLPKKYRHPELDQRLTHRRLISEARMLLRFRKAGISTPTLLFLDEAHYRIYMDRVPGRTVKHALLSGDLGAEGSVQLCRSIGELLARMHNADLVHGDLTTSNIMQRTDGVLVLIDFGLSVIAGGASAPEDKAVDIYVLERAFISTHPDSEDLIPPMIDAYFANLSSPEPIRAKLEEVRARGRKRSMVG
nr:EKC/KEOPS complex subunit [Seculamonas ecuadoriensis]